LEPPINPERFTPAAPDIPLPDLSEITWGETGDGRLTAIGRLRVLSGSR